MTITQITIDKVEVPRITPDGRTVLANLLGQFDELYDEKKAAEKLLEEAKASYDALTQRIKDQVAGLTDAEKVQLDSDKLACVLDYSITVPARATKEGMAWLKVEHPDIFRKITNSDPVCTIRRLFGKRWAKAV